MKKLLSIILSITMLLSMATVAFAEETTTSGAREVEGIIKVGTCADFAPFEYMENGKMLGFDIDLMNYIAARIGYGVEFVNMPFDKLIPSVVNGEVDCAISAITATDERESVVDFTRPYLAADVTYKDEDSETKQHEMYSIVFKDGVADTKYLSRTPTTYERLFMLVNGTIEELISDGTIDKLISKYDLNKPYDEEADYEYGYYEYMVFLETPKTEDTNSTDDIVYDSETSATTVPAPSEWASKDIDLAYAVGIADTNKDYIYKNNITREEFCELIYNLVVLVSPDIEYFIPDSFADTKNEKVLKLNSLGIINGKTATEFAPNDYLTREEAATIIVRMVNKVVPMAATEMWFEYDDINEVSEWASDSIQTISNLGFMNGVGNNRFAPKDTYTTEQAIVTLVRVLESAGASGLLDESASIGIIGGADGPTSIIVGDNVNVIEQEDYDNFYVEVKKNTTKVDDFYIDEAIKLIEESGKLASDKDFISLYTTDDEMTSQMLELGAADYSKPSAIYHLSADKEQIIANIKALAGEEIIEVDLEKLLNHKKLSFAVLPSLINASYGSQNLAALTILTNSRGYVMPKDFKNDFALYFEYDGGCSALVTFSEFGDGVISANMSFVINGDKDNIFRRVFEITQGLGEDSIKIALVK